MVWCVRYLVLLFWLFTSGSGFAYGPAAKENGFNVQCSSTLINGSKVSGSGGTYEAACRNLLESARSAYTDPYYGTNKLWTFGPICTQPGAGGTWPSSGGCTGSFSCGGAGTCLVSASGTGSYSETCVQNSQPDGSGGCTCNVGFRPRGGKCVGYVCPAGAMSGPTGYGPYPTLAEAMLPKTMCISDSTGGVYGGCQYSQHPSGAKGSGSSWWSTGNGSLSGNYCDGKPPLQGSSPDPVNNTEGTQENAPPAVCTSGTCPGTINGSSVCVPCQETAKGPAVETSGGGGLPDPAAPPGAVKSDEYTTCSGGSCTTTTNYYDSGGNVIGEKKTDQTEGGFCKENPGLALCKDSAISGSCDAVSCNGDAIQCAIAREQQKRNCELWNAAPGDHPGVVAAGGGARPVGHPGLTPSAHSMGGLIRTGDVAVGSAGGLSDLSFTVGDASVSIPFSELNSSLAMLGNVIVGVCMLAAAVIVFRG